MVKILHFALDVQGRPKGFTPKFSLAPLVARLSELLGIQVLIYSTSLVLLIKSLVLIDCSD
jgi:phosphoglycerate kinase